MFLVMLPVSSHYHSSAPCPIACQCSPICSLTCCLSVANAFFCSLFYCLSETTSMFLDLLPISGPCHSSAPCSNVCRQPPPLIGLLPISSHCLSSAPCSDVCRQPPPCSLTCCLSVAIAILLLILLPVSNQPHVR
jgi:hypothetical protein